jgi:hypothetical protein
MTQERWLSVDEIAAHTCRAGAALAKADGSEPGYGLQVD